MYFNHLINVKHFKSTIKTKVRIKLKTKNAVSDLCCFQDYNRHSSINSKAQVCNSFQPSDKKICFYKKIKITFFKLALVHCYCLILCIRFLNSNKNNFII